MNGSGIAAKMGLHPKPIGTPEELKAQMIGLAHVGSCAPPGKGVRGCSRYHNCIFRLTKYGGFRRDAGNPPATLAEAAKCGPKYIGFFQRTEEGDQRRDFMDCYTFMMQMYERMRAGERHIQDGRQGEVIRIIAQEGEPITRMIRTNAAPPGQPHNWVKRKETIPVPNFPRPGESAESDFDLELNREEQERMRSDPDLREGPPVAAVDMDGDLEELPDDDPAPEGEASKDGPISAPAKRRKG